MTVVSVDWTQGWSPVIHRLQVAADPVCRTHGVRTCMVETWDNRRWLMEPFRHLILEVPSSKEAVEKLALALQEVALDARLVQRLYEDHRRCVAAHKEYMEYLRAELVLSREEGDLPPEIPFLPVPAPIMPRARSPCSAPAFLMHVDRPGSASATAANHAPSVHS